MQRGARLGVSQSEIASGDIRRMMRAFAPKREKYRGDGAIVTVYREYTNKEFKKKAPR